MELSEAVKVIIGYFESLGFTLDYEAKDDYEEAKWSLLFAPDDKGIIELAKKIKATKDGNEKSN